MKPLLQSLRSLTRSLNRRLFPWIALFVSVAAGAAPWPETTPAEAGLDPDALRAFSQQVGGDGVIIRHGAQVFSWGNPARRRDVASACKPVLAHFLFAALDKGLIPSLDQRVVEWEPRLADPSSGLPPHDAQITWRNLATQTSCYGLAEAPGTAFAYNDWQIALFADLLVGRVYGLSWSEADERLLRPLFVDLLGAEDNPSLLAFGGSNRPGRLAISPRDFARFGWLHLREGQWMDREALSRNLARQMIASPLPADLPRAGNTPTPMLKDQRSLGSQRVPDNQTDHFGSYSFLWWVNGVDRNGQRLWPDAPHDTFAALGHGGKRALFIIPSRDLVVSWNESTISSHADENAALKLLLAAVSPRTVPSSDPRPRLIIETDAGGDPDDEQSLVRFLLYASDWDVEAIIANRPRARDRENRNPERTGLGVVRRLVQAYGECWPQLVANDPRYPSPENLLSRVIPGYNETDDAVQRIIAIVDSSDPRPVWYSDWGTDHGSATNNLRRALDRVLAERGPEGYARFKSRLRLSSADAFGPHTSEIEPPFPLWVDTWRPPVDGVRWYHRFSALTARAGGFDLLRDCLTGHGPLGALYPTNTTHWQKEGDTLSFLCLVPNGMNDPERPHWGGWGGRSGHNPEFPGKPYFWANQQDAWNGTTRRDNTLKRWAADLQNDFKARLDACVKKPSEANHPPVPRLNAGPFLNAVSGEELVIRADPSADPDDDALTFEWIHYPEPGTFRGDLEWRAQGPTLSVTTPEVTRPETLHFILRLTDDGDPPLSRYARVVITVSPASPAPRQIPAGNPLESAVLAPRPLDPGSERRVLRFNDGRPVITAADFAERRRELRAYWDEVLGPWPPLLESPRFERAPAEEREGILQSRCRVEIARDQIADAWLLRPPGEGPFPAVLVVYYEPETSVGLNPRQELRDFGLQLARRGFVTLSIGTPGGDAWRPDIRDAACQPLSYHACVAANCWRALAALPEVDASRIGVTGHSYGGKWALFAAALWEPFAAVAVSDPGVMFDESRPNVNYWEPWYLGLDPNQTRRPGIPTPENPRTGAYAKLIADGRDLDEIHALIAPRPFLISGGPEDPPEREPALRTLSAINARLGHPDRVLITHRETHAPTEPSNARLYAFFEWALRPARHGSP